ncbi:Ser/Thr protein phosphatase [Tritrichomonas foetus]|uniref:Serine/threonine-protein phosphatase n=1 Tax=Tritrichomonas foetus TaxID=1144522 RepID=A0A1J4JSY1_9EUKA|nr:Ser/Thr protein phosphatase [Tritrichomonas foetus]|eukprot:OHT02171.1 Ser/Thr protein phosphatase [Tritrichomonas foetus]
MDVSFDDILKVYQGIIKQFDGQPTLGKRKLRLPILHLDTLNSLIEECRKTFENEPIILSLRAPVIIVGDLHGHIFDLFHILKKYGYPPETKYLFLGDIVDRGEFSTETLTLILTMKALYPDDIYVIRGNHEFGEIADHCGFFSELISLYGNHDEIIQTFLMMFSYIPLAAKIGDYAFCVHGGIGPSLILESQIANLQRPITTFDDPLVADILWSDPSPDSPDFSSSSRGMGHLFGVDTIKSFLNRTGYSVLIRGHQCVTNGFEYHLSYKVVTVFSASNYCGDSHNKAAILKIEEDERYNCENFEPLQNYILRINVALTPIDIMKPKKGNNPNKQICPPISHFNSNLCSNNIKFDDIKFNDTNKVNKTNSMRTLNDVHINKASSKDTMFLTPVQDPKFASTSRQARKLMKPGPVQGKRGSYITATNPSRAIGSFNSRIVQYQRNPL